MSDTVYGVALQPGEEVVYFHRWEPGWRKTALIVAGILLSYVLVGIVLLIVGLLMTTTCFVITRRRFLIITRKKVRELRQEQVAKVTRGVTRSGAVQWYERSDASGATKLRYEASKAPGIQTLLDTFAAERNVLQWTPAVAFEALPATKS